MPSLNTICLLGYECLTCSSLIQQTQYVKSLLEDKISVCLKKKIKLQAKTNISTFNYWYNK